MAENFAIEMRGITKTFGSVVANNGINLNVKPGEILALLGENGSGKTTLMNMLSGIYQPDSGSILVNGKEVSIRSPEDSKRLGIGMVHQHFITIRLKEPVYTGALSTWSDQWIDWYEQLHDILRSYGYGGIYMPVSADLRDFGGSVDAFLAEFDRFLDAYEAFFGWRPFPCEDPYQEGDFVSLCFDAEQLQPVYERETNKLSSSRKNAITKDLVAYYVHKADLRTGMQLYNSIGKICDTMYYQLLTYDHAHYRYNSAFRGLTFGVTMCQGYSEIFQLFAEYCGVQSVIVEGSIRSEAHAWNKVTFSDGTVRYVDVTNLGADYLILVPWSHMAEIGFKLK